MAFAHTDHKYGRASCAFKNKTPLRAIQHIPVNGPHNRFPPVISMSLFNEKKLTSALWSPVYKSFFNVRESSHSAIEYALNAVALQTKNTLYSLNWCSFESIGVIN